MKILTILGARPQFIKAATVSRAINEHNSFNEHIIEEIIVHTGQHYDANMSDVFFEELDIPRPDYKLSFGNLGHGAMTGRMVEKLEDIIQKEKPSLVMVYGDTNSTLAGALAASKLQIPIAHVEAGLRSFNMAMPEEINRILTDRISSYLFCPTDVATVNLKKEGFPFSTALKKDQKIFNVGDVMYDATLFYREKAMMNISLDLWSLTKKNYALCTIHRAENTDDLSRLTSILDALNEINSKLKVVLPMHPRTSKILEENGISKLSKALTIINPVSYLEMQRLEIDSSIILTDSGGVQKEAFFHGVPCVTLREETEWVETVESGWNVLVGSCKDKILDAFENSSQKNLLKNVGVYGDGCAASNCINNLLANFK